MNSKSSPTWLVHGALFVVSLIFGINSVTAKIAMKEIDPMALVFIRIVSAAIILFILQKFFIREKIQSARDYFLLAFFSLFGITINQVLFLKGLALTTAINATILVTTIPVATIAVALILRKEAASVRKILGTILSFVGVFFLLGTERIDFRNDYFVGNLFVFLNAVSFGIYLVISRNLLRRYHPATVTAWTFIFGAIGVFPFGIQQVMATDFFSISPAGWWCITFLIIFSSVIVYYINNWALQRTSSSTVAVYIYVQPIIATLISTLMMGEDLRWQTVFASLLIFAGVFIVSLKMREELNSTKKEKDLFIESAAMRED